MKNVAAVIVTHNSAREVGGCLDAVIGRVDEVVVVDNASRDNTREEVIKRPTVRFIANATNRGFAAAVNQGISAVDTDCVLLLNPDAVLLTGIDGLLKACRRPGVAAAAGKLVDEQGQAQKGFNVRRFPTPLSLSFEVLGCNRIFPWNPVNRRYRCLDLDLASSAEVEQPAGAFLMIRRNAWRAVGGFDEGFAPLWFEDVDFLKRLHERSYRVVYEPSAVAKHVGAHSLGSLPQDRRELYWYASLLRYCVVHYRPLQRRGVCVALLLGSAFRMTWGLISKGRVLPVRIYGKVMRLAFSTLVEGRPAGAENKPIVVRR
jgi:GT2 family glycosyltransferase